jgi:peptide/nickel transport system permease protein
VVEQAALPPTVRLRAPRRAGGGLWGQLRGLGKSRIDLAGVVLVVALVAIGAVGPLVLPDALAVAPGQRFQPPSWAHPFGTDNLGRDQLARVVLGLRLSMLVSVAAVLVGLVIGAILGLVAGYYGGTVDNLIMRVLDVFFAFPGLLLALSLIAVLGPSIPNLMLTMGLLFAPSMARVTRGPVLALKEREFVEAARALGVRESAILFVHIFPNVLAPIVVTASLQLSAAILIESGLSFLGLGINPPNPSLGGLISTGRTNLDLAPWLSIFPGLAITLLVVGFNLLGDGLRDALDPRLRGSVARAGTVVA